MSRKRFIVVGLGKFGASISATLHGLGHEVAAIDRSAERVDRLGRGVTRAAVGDGTNPVDLKRLGAENADAAIISTGPDITASALSALVMRDLGVEEVFVKVTSDDHARLIEKIGVTETIFPEKESGVRLGRRIANRLLLDYVDFVSGIGLQEMAVPNAWIGHSLRELALPKKLGLVVVAVHDMLREEVQATPDPDALLKDSDTLIVAGKAEDLDRAAVSYAA
jgi:trk system potassium uptake protein TrkA